VKKKESEKLTIFSGENAFAKILEAKIDTNYKIAKILSNALHW